MSISGIPSSNPFDYSNPNIPNNPRQFGQEFSQLGQDLQAGNLSAAQQDFVTLRKLAPQGSTPTPTAYSPIIQQFNQLGQDLQSGNLSAAQQDYAQLKPELDASAARIRHHHRFPGAEGSQIAQLFQQLGQALKSGDLSSAQKTYATLQQDFQQVRQGSEPSTAQSSQSNTTAVSVTA